MLRSTKPQRKLPHGSQRGLAELAQMYGPPSDCKGKVGGSKADASGKLVMECVIETKAITILEFVHGLRGSLHLTFEEGTWAAWLYDLLKPHVVKLVVCDPRRNGYLKQGSKSDRNDARKLAELLHSNMLRPVYHGEHGVRSLKELARSYLTITKD
jgi:hypothetical protein